MFYGTNSIKRHVVGRGVLTERDRAILMMEDDHPTPQQSTSTRNTRTEVTMTSDTDGGQTTIVEADPLSLTSDEQHQAPPTPPPTQQQQQQEKDKQQGI